MNKEDIFNTEKEEEINSIFYKLENYNNILAFDKDERDIDRLLKYVNDDEYIIVNLTVSELLKKRFFEKYELQELPVLLSYGTKIYERENMTQILEIRQENERIFYNREIDNFVTKKKIVIFIKGTPDKPECKFTKELIENFDELKLKNGKDYTYFNIKMNDKWRQMLKVKNNWPTFPQIYIDQLFVGGLDVFKKMKEKNIVQKMIFPGETDL
ncbi:Glutaredoxin-related protein [Pseudoloma neurophilia]|uniref:Glutaredoxin-related protein n=1 Tax=Pseudoloma neurophilia TaxID=146866 RepID=A0A0R0LVL0_9MICR|nr:Glutaredoxin-related protein [Pseudoloma neurophilia]